MARTVNEIFDAIVAEKETRANLNDLTPNPETSFQLLDRLSTGSKSAAWGLVFYIVAWAIYLHELQFDLLKTEVDEKLVRSVAGSAPWWQELMKAFQYGDQLELIDGRFQYATIDTTKQIIAQASVQDLVTGGALIKVAKAGIGFSDELNSDSLTIGLDPLTAEELAAAQSYMQQNMLPGTRIGIVSLEADSLAPVYDIYYNPQIPLSQVKNNCQVALLTYINNLPFDGELVITKMTDALQLAQGVVDPVFQSCVVTPNAGQAASVTVDYLPASGYFQLEDLAGNLFNFIAA